MIGTLGLFFRNWVLGNLRTSVVIFVVLVLLFGANFSAQSVFFPAAREVVYQRELHTVNCPKIRLCFVRLNLLIANTGSQDQTRIVFTVSGLPEKEPGEPYVTIAGLTAGDLRTAGA
jgi:hypothetical protein